MMRPFTMHGEGWEDSDPYSLGIAGGPMSNAMDVTFRAEI